jgi:hypothetical protein
MADTKKAYWEAKNTRFSEPSVKDDYLHLDARAIEPGPELTETQYIGFNIPEQNIHSCNYLWHHANLGVVTGGAWAWQGIKTHSLSCELFDFHTYVDDSVLTDDLRHYRLPNSYEVDVIKPLELLRVRYSDDARGNAFDVELEALAEPMVLQTGFHLEQPMKTRGSLTLAGKDYEVDGYTVRDRSWGQLRKEVHSDLPPITWMTGVFGPDLSFGTTAFDSEDRDPHWKGVMGLPDGDPLRGGWINRDGVHSPVVSVEKRTHRNSVTFFPETVEMTITDASGFTLDLRGTITAAADWRAWHNMNMVICLTRWEADGRVAYGDFQDVLSHGYLRRFFSNSAGVGAPTV